MFFSFYRTLNNIFYSLALTIVLALSVFAEEPKRITSSIALPFQKNITTQVPPMDTALFQPKIFFSESDNQQNTNQDFTQKKKIEIPALNTNSINAPRVSKDDPDAFVAAFEDYVAEKIAPYVPGIAVAIVSEGQIKSLQSYGVRRAGTKEKITPDTVFRLASLSKPVAATAAGVMVNEGKLDWSSRVVSELPDIKFRNSRYGNQVNLSHVLSQSTGFPRHTYSYFIDANMSYSELTQKLRYANFVCPPGKCFAYQNVVYSLVGDIIQRHAGESFEDYVKQKIFDPLDMQSASYGLENYNASPNRAAPHVASGRRWFPAKVTDNWYRVAPAAGVNASIVDMSQFLLAQIGKRPDVLPTEVLDSIQTRITKNTPAQNYYSVRKPVSNTAYGMGWRVFDYGQDKNFVHHGGHVKGFRSEMVFNRELQMGMVLLTNSETHRVRDVIFKFLDYYEQTQEAYMQASQLKNKENTQQQANVNSHSEKTVPKS
jgi:beta-lactamase class C